MTSDEPRITGSIGGQPKSTYWTPDGRVIRAMPDIHEYLYKGENGLRDANLDKGWLLQKPSELKLYCPHCDYWHDTEGEIKGCKLKHTALIAKHTKKAKKELGGLDRIDKLEKDMGEIKDLLKKLLER